MFTFAIVLNSLAIVLIIANAIYDAVTLENSTTNNGSVNLIGIGYVLIIFTSRYLKNTGKPILAMLLAWGPALPVLFICFYLIMLLFIKGDWK